MHQQGTEEVKHADLKTGASALLHFPPMPCWSNCRQKNPAMGPMLQAGVQSSTLKCHPGTTIEMVILKENQKETLIFVHWVLIIF